ncbi:Ribonuclease H-like domain protein [Actinidia chinensis var. chinensis]|uniref:Ribonuclease H-like domain protein n=1 Tax=Actinidia chinensis var. chinensis TaxID=1590841 RepID=A0A2R6PMA5_ACTCC|nr:Ribonuclease H-like domain protein [Actinidia chinensis var. chinensis]
MEITVTKHDNTDLKYNHDNYTVYVGAHRILTIVTMCPLTAAKWLKEVLKSHRNKRRPLVIGVYVDRRRQRPRGGDHSLAPYELLSLCIGSHCLIFHLPEPNEVPTAKRLRAFLADPNIVAVGMDMVSVAKRLEEDQGIKFSNPMDLNAMAVNAIKNMEKLDLARYSLERLAKVMLGRDMYVIRPGYYVEWYEPQNICWYDLKLRSEKVKYVTLDSYFTFMVVWGLLDMMISSPFASSSTKKKKTKK